MESCRNCKYTKVPIVLLQLFRHQLPSPFYIRGLPPLLVSGTTAFSYYCWTEILLLSETLHSCIPLVNKLLEQEQDNNTIVENCWPRAQDPSPQLAPQKTRLHDISETANATIDSKSVACSHVAPATQSLRSTNHSLQTSVPSYALTPPLQSTPPISRSTEQILTTSPSYAILQPCHLHLHLHRIRIRIRLPYKYIQ